MYRNSQEFLKTRLKDEHFNKLNKICNPYVEKFLAEHISLCNPADIFICDGSNEDINYIKEQAIITGEEKKLKISGHTVHFDGYDDQARDKENTKFLVPKDIYFDPNLNKIDREEGLREIKSIMKDIMQGHTMYILFFCLGPTNSIFSIPCIQITDSPYVAHSEILLYRQGYKEFQNMKNQESFFKFVHSEGELENGVSKNIDKRRIYIDLEEDIVYSANTQYGGNTIGLKKLAMRLAIKRGSKEGWLTEHMFLMGVLGPNNRKTYFTGAFPSLCGKTSTSMLPGEKIVGDDISYLRVKNDKVYAVNVEKGMFGIVGGIKEKDAPILWKVLNTPNEIIFSNILVTEDNLPFWEGKGEVPEKGFNYSGEWYKGKKDKQGKEIPPSHKNARFTLSLEILPNVDENLHNPDGVEVGGIIYGGRDSDTSVPVEESFDWTHGIITKGASLESETTAATLGKVGVRKFNPMSNLDFLSISIGKYIENNLKFGEKAKKLPKIFSVNYFLKDENGNFLNDKADKSVWIKWMELRCHNDVDALKIPTGYIPLYEDLKKLFKHILDKEYKEEDYVKQFTLRIPENLARIDRIINIYKTKVPDTPEILFKVLTDQKRRLEDARAKYGDYVSPFKFIS